MLVLLFGTLCPSSFEIILMRKRELVVFVNSVTSSLVNCEDKNQLTLE